MEVASLCSSEGIEQNWQLSYQSLFQIWCCRDHTATYPASKIRTQGTD